MQWTDNTMKDRDQSLKGLGKENPEETEGLSKMISVSSVVKEVTGNNYYNYTLYKYI